MATIRSLKLHTPDRLIPQKDAECSIILGELDGEKFIQLDSYGSKDREFVGKRSQSMRLTEEAFEQLMRLGTGHFQGR